MIRARALPAVSVLLVALAGCGSDDKPTAQPSAASSSRAPLPLMVRGTFTLELPNFVCSEDTMTCAGTGGHDDLTAGTQVVTDPAGVNLAVGKLDVGQPQVDPDDKHRATQCLFAF